MATKQKDAGKTSDQTRQPVDIDEAKLDQVAGGAPAAGGDRWTDGMTEPNRGLSRPS